MVPAGGQSRRMGRDKATMPHPGGGATMVEHTVEVLGRRCSPVFVIAAPGQSLPALCGAEVLRDDVPGLGPLAATGRGLRAAADAGCEWAFVAAVDMPYLSADLIDLLDGHRAGVVQADVVLPWDGRDHYLAGLYRTALAGRVEALVAGGARSMRALTGAVRTEGVVLPPDSTAARALINVNAPADLPPE